jgi:ribosomal protein S18 acetylase RimI-like enzyme
VTEATIRPITADDAEEWCAIRLEALRVAPTAFSSSYEETRAMDAAQIAQRIPSGVGADALFGAFLAGALAGTAGFHVQAGLKLRHKGTLWGVYVREPARGAGIGEALVRAAIERARRHVAVLQLTVAAQNEPARRLYTRLGFVDYGLERRALRIDGEDHDQIRMALDFGNRL